ncbi:N-6 DNA methylase [Priestia megaterium]|uniref:N-6 DNA methylase n=1 Tax=Priestia megaterium TaxID=1404 RepID=UPI001BE52970|nr:type I restriction-modification system subunit M/S [Priestia megaterium]MBT2253840.1 N-6 DNA methylase [Priestia megaterium]
MKKEEFVFKTSDIMRGSMKQPLNESVIAVGTLLTIEREQPGSLKQLAQSQRVELQINEFLNQLDFEDNLKECMQSEMSGWVNQLSSKEVSDILLLMDKALISNSANDLFDEYIFRSNSGSSIAPMTPNSVNHIVETYFMPKNQQTLTFHDGTAGYGFSATSFGKKYSEVELNLQEVSVKAATILKIRLHLLDLDANITVADLLEEPIFTEENQMKQFDFVSMSPPWGVKLSEAQVTAMKNDEFNRYVYGIPSRSQGDFAFVSCGLSATRSTGKAAFWLPAGTLFRSGPEQKIRQRLIDLDLVEAIVLLPSNLLAPYSAIASVLLLCNKNKTKGNQGKILMVNASELGTSNRKETFISEEKLRLVDDILKQGIEKDAISKFVLNTDIQSAQLSPEVYVYKEEIELEEYGKVKLNTDALDQLETLPLKDIVTLYRGYNASTKDEDDNGEYAVLKIADIVNGEIQFDELSKYNIKNNAKVDNNRILHNDILLSIRGTNRKVAIFQSHRQDVLMSQNFVGIRCSDSLLPAFLKLYLESPIVQFYFSKHMAGSTVPNLPIKEVNNLPIPVLSLDRQEAIVKQYEEETANIAKKLEELRLRQKQSKLEAFENMGLKHTFKLQ